MLNTTVPRRALLALATAMLVAAQPGASLPARQANAPGGAGQTAAPAASDKPEQKTAAAPAAQRPVLRTTTRLVQVSVIAHDGHGDPISDLTQEDFRLFDNGTEQKIDFFSKDSSEIRTENLPALPADTWSNRATSRGGALPVNLTIVL